MLTNAYAMGGTVRAVLTLAGHLAQTREVEVIALKRGARATPFFPHPPGVIVTTLDDRRKSRRGIVERALAALPSLLVHPEDYGYPAASLWTDVKLLPRLRGAGGEIVIDSCPPCVDSVSLCSVGSAWYRWTFSIGSDPACTDCWEAVTTNEFSWYCEG